MTERKWTPGPWRLKQGKVKKDGSRACYVSGAGWSKFAKVWVRSTELVEAGTDDIDGISNAHLIAAAPDLYEALDSLVDKIMDIRGIDIEFYAPNQIKTAAAALSKARGETNV